MLKQVLILERFKSQWLKLMMSNVPPSVLTDEC